MKQSKAAEAGFVLFNAAPIRFRCIVKHLATSTDLTTTKVDDKSYPDELVGVAFFVVSHIDGKMSTTPYSMVHLTNRKFSATASKN